jgi:hypothetical protein
VPAYICESVLKPLAKLGAEPVFYDIDPEDLNGSPQAMLRQARKHGARVALAASLYGHPADLPAFEAAAREEGLLLVDDAAQSFGASIAGRPVGTFGDAGFFSLSPGKATAGHMGGFYWTRFPYDPVRTRHDWIHRCKWLLFRHFRLHPERSPLPGAAFALAQRLTGKLDGLDIWNDGMAPFEVPLVAAIVNAQIADRHGFRARYAAEAVRRFAGIPGLRLAGSLRGESRPHKLVLIADAAARADRLHAHLDAAGISLGRGYARLAPDPSAVPAASSAIGRVVELPIEDDDAKMEAVFRGVESFPG